jgi:hypothetical protein
LFILAQGWAKNTHTWRKNNNKNMSISPSNTKKYNVYFKRYVQTFVKETVRSYTSMKEFGLAKDV